MFRPSPRTTTAASIKATATAMSGMACLLAFGPARRGTRTCTCASNTKVVDRGASLCSTLLVRFPLGLRSAIARRPRLARVIGAIALLTRTLGPPLLALVILAGIVATCIGPWSVAIGGNNCDIQGGHWTRAPYRRFESTFELNRQYLLIDWKMERETRYGRALVTDMDYGAVLFANRLQGQSDFEWNGPGSWLVAIRLWQVRTALAILLVPCLYVSWRVLRPIKLKGTCPRCRYNLAGLPAGSPCPECGTPPVTLPLPPE